MSLVNSLYIIMNTYMYCLFFKGKSSWTREEALSSILAVEMVDLPVSHLQAQMEDEFGSNKGKCQTYLNCGFT